MHRLLKLCVLFLPTTLAAIVEKPVVIVIPSYNNASYYERNLCSVFEQGYENFRVIYVDDASIDGTYDLVRDYIQDNQFQARVTLVRNDQNRGALYNLYHAIHTCDDDEIIATLDGDDWFAHPDVLKTLNDAYSDDDVWLTFGQYHVYPWDIAGHCAEFPQDVIENNAYRKYHWQSSHLRTYYAGLFKQIRLEDLMHNKEFFPTTLDLATMFPMLEMAGGRHKFIAEVLYIYNRETPLNDEAVSGRDRQVYYEDIVRLKAPYDRLVEKLWS